MARSPEADRPARAAAQRPLAHARRAVLFADVVESVRLYELDPEAVARGWLGLVEGTRLVVAGLGDGRIVKHTGDGMLLELEDARSAVEVAFAMLRMSEARGAAAPPDRRIRLRFGAALGDVIRGEADIYGHDVNVAARLLGLAEPGELMVTGELRDHLTADVDAEVVDIGECYLRHVSRPVRAFRIRPLGARPQTWPIRPFDERMTPAIAVLPLDAASGQKAARMVGDALADELIEAISRPGTLDVISRLSSRALAGRGLGPAVIAERLGVDYLLSGTFRSAGAGVRVGLELCETGTGRAIWSSPYELAGADLSTDRTGYLTDVVRDVIRAITTQEVRLVRRRPLPTLRAHTLLTAAVNLMHRLNRRDFDRARDVLEVLLERAPGEPLALARMAQWWVMRAQQGWAVDLRRDSYLAASAAARAVDEDPDCSIALMADGAVQAHFFKRLDLAEQRYDAAIGLDQSNAMAWLRRGTLCAFTDRGDRAVAETLRAQRLSPFDPSRFLYDSLTASAFLTAGDDASALAYAERSLRLNRLHTSTLRVKAVALWRLGREAQARCSVGELLRLEPGLTVSRYLGRMPSADYRIGREVAEILAKAGVPG